MIRPAPDLATLTPYELLERSLTILIRRSASKSEHIAERLHPDLDGNAYALIAHIALVPGVRASDLAAHVGIGRATVSRQLARLATLGLIEREVDPEDSRGQLLSLSEAGYAAFDAAHDARVAGLSQVIAAWPIEDVSTFTDLLDRYAEDWLAWRDLAGTGDKEQAEA